MYMTVVLCDNIIYYYIIQTYYGIMLYRHSYCRIVLYIIVKLQYRTIEMRQIKFVLLTNQDLYWLCIINDYTNAQYILVQIIVRKLSIITLHHMALESLNWVQLQFNTLILLYCIYLCSIEQIIININLTVFVIFKQRCTADHNNVTNTICKTFEKQISITCYTGVLLHYNIIRIKLYNNNNLPTK